MFDRARAQWAARYTYVGYEPQPVNGDRLRAWLSQFDRSDQPALLSLLRRVRYRSENELRSSLGRQAGALLADLRRAGFAPDHVVFMSVSEAASSSPRFLSQLRTDARLEQMGCQFLDGKDFEGITSLSSQLRDYAIVYVDDFLGTGNQFIDARDEVASFAFGNFSEFFLVGSACEEGYSAVKFKGVEVITPLIHERAGRPLHPLSSELKISEKDRLLGLSRELGLGDGLGYESMATMVINFNNAPDTTPALLRGSRGQVPFAGIFPRTTDF